MYGARKDNDVLGKARIQPRLSREGTFLSVHPPPLITVQFIERSSLNNNNGANGVTRGPVSPRPSSDAFTRPVSGPGRYISVFMDPDSRLPRNGQSRETSGWAGKIPEVVCDWLCNFITCCVAKFKYPDGSMVNTGGSIISSVSITHMDVEK